MCGIAGFVGSITEVKTRDIFSTISHRGPDNQGSYFDDKDNVNLFHTRLSIIDLANGSQPMMSSDGNIVIIFNGEIYNHSELKLELEGLGHKFGTDHSDTETIIYAYKQWGSECLYRFNGMFAFCIFDKKSNSLFLARDRFGKKPLFYSCIDNLFTFGSELTSIEKMNKFLQVSTKSLAKYFSYGFIPAPATLYEQVYKLNSGSFLLYDITKKSVKIKRYWRYKAFRGDLEFKIKREELEESLRFAIGNAVRRTMKTDVDFGFFLSGGLDSNIVLSEAAASAKYLNTFSIGFADPSYDESALAIISANFYSTNHQCKVFSEKKLLDNFFEAISCMDEPIADSSIIPTYALSSFARQEVKVALSGDGGDELFYGYSPFMALRYRRINSLIPKLVKNSLSKKLFIVNSNEYMSLGFKLKQFFRNNDNRLAMCIPQWMSPFGVGDVNALLGTNFSTDEIYEDVLNFYDEFGSSNIYDWASEYFTEFYLQNDVLQKVDRASMANGLEVRSPLLDNEVVDVAQQIPSFMKIDMFSQKSILKSSYEKKLPIQILAAKKKGFGIPIGGMVKTMDVSVFKSDYFDNDIVDTLFIEHQKGFSDNRLELFALAAMAHKLN